MAYLEHANVTVTNPEQTAQRLIDLFNWNIRWSGAAMNQGHTIHVGTKDCYLALYTHKDTIEANSNGLNAGHLNHLAVVVDDIEQASNQAYRLGLEPFNFGEYQPGKRFYVMIDKDLELEVVSYN